MCLNTDVLHSLLAQGKEAISLGGGAMPVPSPGRGDPAPGLKAAGSEWDLSIPASPAAAPRRRSEAKHDRLFTAVSWRCR